MGENTLRAGDQVATAEQLDGLPTGTHWECGCGYPGTKLGPDLFMTGARKHTRADIVEDHLPLTIRSVPGEQPHVSGPAPVTAEQLDALPLGSIVEYKDGKIATHYAPRRWKFNGETGGMWSAYLALRLDSLRIRYVPEDPSSMPEPAPATVEEAARVIEESREMSLAARFDLPASAVPEASKGIANALSDAGLLRTPVTAEQVEAAGRASKDALDYIPYDNDLTDEDVHRLMGRAALKAAGFDTTEE